jgi:hypothetical protein
MDTSASVRELLLSTAGMLLASPCAPAVDSLSSGMGAARLVLGQGVEITAFT